MGKQNAFFKKYTQFTGLISTKQTYVVESQKAACCP